MTDELEASPRVTGSVLGAVECRLLIHLAKAMPAGISSNMLTVTGLVGAGIASAAYYFCNWNIHFLWLASAGLILNWFGDSLDGTLARVRRKERRRYGFVVDHSVDLVAQVLIGLGLGASPFIRFDIACIALIVYLCFAAFTFIKTVTSGELQISYAGIGPTEVRCALITVNLMLVWFHPQVVAVLWAPMSVIDLAVLIASVLAAGVLAIGAMTEIRRVAAEDP